jgi:hypothetical protein
VLDDALVIEVVNEPPGRLISTQPDSHTDAAYAPSAGKNDASLL